MGRTEHSFSNQSSANMAFPAVLPDHGDALRTLLDSSPLAIFTLDVEGTVLTWNKAAEHMTGWSAAETLGKPYPLLRQLGGRDAFNSIHDRVLAHGAIRNHEMRAYRKDGSTMDLRFSAGCIRDAQGAITGMIGLAEDITARKALEAERNQLFHESQQLLMVCDLDGSIRRVNDACVRVLGYPADQLLGTAAIDLVHPDDREATAAHIRDMHVESSTSFENRCRTREGTYRWILWRGSVAADGKSHYKFGTDITDHKAFEQELWEAHAETERVLAAISSILIRVDDQKRITRWNSAAEATFGLDSFAAIGRHFGACARWADPRMTDEIFACGAEPTRLEDLRFTGIDGKDHFVTLTVTSLQRGAGADGFLVLGSDVTEHKILEEQLRQAQKLEAIGQLAAGIAHEINTPTQYVGDNTRFLQDAFRDLEGLFAGISRIREHLAAQEPVTTEALQELDREAARADLEYLCREIPIATGQSLEGVQRVTRIVRAMKEFSHPSEAKVAVDLNRAIETTMIVAQNELKYVADTKTEFDTQLPLVPCLPGEVNQVILNLLINAAHAIADVVRDTNSKGVITVSTHRSDDWAEIRVSDTGTGIPEAARARVFEPFFTTKQVGRGTGQGLALAHTVIVKKHGGHIWFETASGRGTTFFVRLPLLADTDTAEVAR